MDHATLARFWAKVDKNGPVPPHKPWLGPCWPWLRALDQGYGGFYYQGLGYKAHRFSYELLVRPIPEGMTLDHICHNKPPDMPRRRHLRASQVRESGPFRSSPERDQHGPLSASHFHNQFGKAKMPRRAHLRRRQSATYWHAPEVQDVPRLAGPSSPG
jgi:hypothetical protein